VSRDVLGHYLGLDDPLVAALNARWARTVRVADLSATRSELFARSPVIDLHEADETGAAVERTTGEAHPRGPEP
jgi:hypothetical protein